MRDRSEQARLSSQAERRGEREIDHPGRGPPTRASATTRSSRGINLDIPAGTTTVILGGSGRGKTVLMKHMIGLLKPDRGRVIVEGEDIVAASTGKLERVRPEVRDGVSGRRAVRLDDRLRQRRVSAARAQQGARRGRDHAAGRGEARDRRASKGSRRKFPAELSGGMRKRVGLARAIMLDRKIVLYDEPTTGLDPITTDYVDEMIRDAKAKLGVTRVVISHDIASAFNIARLHRFPLRRGDRGVRTAGSGVKNSPHEFVQKFLGTWFRKN